MKKKALALTVGIALSGFAGFAQGTGKIKAGEAKAAPCAGCHGEDGNSLTPMFPKIAGQHASYLVRQLDAFKHGTRINPTMQGFASSLSDEDIADLAAFYAAQKISPNGDSPADDDDEDEESEEPNGETSLSEEEQFALGKKIYESGNKESGVSACIACHNPTGHGNKPAGFPVVKAQHADYVYKSLQDFRAGMRGSDFSKMMQMVAVKMTDQEMKAVAAYIAKMK